MDALDEFFSQWCAPEAWCERCGEHPALHVVRRAPGAKDSGFPTYVRVWDAAQQSYRAACRQCVKYQGNPIGETVQQPVSIPPHPPDKPWLQTLRRFLRSGRYRVRLYVTKWWQSTGYKSRIPKTENLRS